MKYQRKMVKYDTNFTASIYYILFGKWMKKKKNSWEFYRFNEEKLYNKMQIWNYLRITLITLSSDKKFTNKFKNNFNKYNNNIRINFSNFRN